MSELVHATVHDTIATVTLDNPAKMGALSVAAMRQLNAKFKEIGQRQDIHVVILASEGKVFSAGHDLSEVHGADEDAQREIFETCTALML
ncbi:MAG: enoyl-CoA hydratase/isomerase family protein, partial [Yaniella sp.]